MSEQQIHDLTPEQEESTRYASRKFLLAAVAIAGAGALRAFNLIDGAQTVELVKWSLGLYFAANVGQKASEWFSLK